MTVHEAAYVIESIKAAVTHPTTTSKAALA
jgi:hypothetical protein